MTYLIKQVFEKPLLSHYSGDDTATSAKLNIPFKEFRFEDDGVVNVYETLVDVSAVFIRENSVLTKMLVETPEKIDGTGKTFFVTKHPFSGYFEAFKTVEGFKRYFQKHIQDAADAAKKSLASQKGYELIEINLCIWTGPEAFVYGIADWSGFVELVSVVAKASMA